MTGPAILALSEMLSGARLDAVPPTTAERAADCILDVLGAALAGRHMPGARAMAKAIRPLASSGSSTLWFGEGGGVAAIPAATLNAMNATVLDVDDGHRRAAGHPGAAVVAAAIAVAEETDATLEDLVTATVVGYEAAIRVALARRPAHHTSTVSGRWSGVGAAASAAWLKHGSAASMAQAILIAEQHAPRAGSALHHGFAGSDVKEAIAWSVHTGLYAIELAQCGFRGYPDTFDQDILYDPVELCRDLDQFVAIGGLFFKPYACCRWIHAAIDALAEIMQAHRLTPETIDKVTVHTFQRAVDLGNQVAPRTEVEAQFSIPFMLGVTAIHGKAALLPLDVALLADGRVQDFAQKVVIRHDRQIESEFPVKAPARVEVEIGSETLCLHVDAAFGDPTNPMSRDDLQRKFARLAEGELSLAAAARLVESLDGWQADRRQKVRDWAAHLRQV